MYVLGINAQEKKIALSIKRTQAEPWSRVAAKYEVGQLVRGTVTQLANFGAFARIEDGIEGLIHVSEIADDRVTHPKQAVKEGQDLLLRIIRIDPQRRRMGLSLRRALDTADEDLLANFGETALEERDRIMDELRESLAAEGIELNLASSPSDDELGESSSSDSSDSSDVELTAPIAASTPVSPVNQTNEGRAAEKKERPRREREKPVEIPKDLEDSSLSAMELAFAMAGAQADADEEEGEKDESK